MNRFYVEKEHIDKDKIKITGRDDVHHIARVLRLRPGEELFISDGDGGGYITEIEKIDKNCVDLKIKDVKKRRRRADRNVMISLACAIPKNARFEDIIGKATQLGVDEIIPLLTDRTLVEKGAFDKKAERFRRVIISSAKQSGALFLPELKEATVFEDLINGIGQYELRLLPNLARKGRILKDVVSSFKGKKILVLIGPEGDFSKREIEVALNSGCVSVDLGESVLRVDTAALSVMSFLSLYFK